MKQADFPAPNGVAEPGVGMSIAHRRPAVFGSGNWGIVPGTIEGRHVRSGLVFRSLKR